ncbi:helix-turn-helix transcriptional regulator [Clostridium swellfunianum]|uniref:winged helix-turn-helix transcriptional regulator n=1 Tax=Clostridium swellfunianum TaxID=1367462 RepID=UPI0020300F2B|nr:helix-turn-helix domain-containing protein [Clostridium swellfunianum]MCM0650513.1 helix-turn-helix transcriptional regulator [Clostridium swellfunianum]
MNKEKYKCPLEYTQKVVGGKWKPVILWYLSTEGTKRYGELKRYLTNISHKMLSQQLKELEMDKLIHRKEYQQIPPKVEYSISERGKTLLPILKMMHDWGVENTNI